MNNDDEERTDGYDAHRPTGLVLTGGGARAAYQVGVLRAIVQILSSENLLRGNPFPIIAGTSAGAINGAALACGADDMETAVDALYMVWQNFRAEQVYRADTWGVIETGAKWLSLFSLGWALHRWRRARPRSLLDNSPLAGLLQELIPLSSLPRQFRRGHLKALSISASSYTTGHHVTFYQSHQEIEKWERSQRMAVEARLTHDHLLASSAIPFIFPAVKLPIAEHDEYFGDGSMRQAAPLSPAIHLGAKRLLIIGAGRMTEPKNQIPPTAEYPNLAQIAGHALSNIFLDALAVDVERLQRVNHTISLLDPAVAATSSLRPIQSLVISPTQRLDEIAAEHIGQLPPAIRSMLKSVGVSKNDSMSTARGSALASYLLFERDYTQALMTLGEADARAQRHEIIQFFSAQ